MNKTRVKPKGLDTVNLNPKVDYIKLAHMWGIEIERAMTNMMATTQNAVQDLSRPLTKRFRMRQEMLRCRRFSRTTYTKTMIAGIRYASGNRFAQVYVTNFGDIRIYPLSHRREDNT